MKKILIAATIFMAMCVLSAEAQSLSNKVLTPSERDSGIVMRFSLEGGTAQTLSVVVEYEFNPIITAGIGVGGMYHTKSGWGLPIFTEARAYFPNCIYSGYANVRLGYVAGLGDGRQVLTAQTLYSHQLTDVFKLGGFITSLGLGFCWRHLDAGINLGIAYGSFKKTYTDGDQTFDQWKLGRMRNWIANIQISYSLPLWRPPYNQVIRRNNTAYPYSRNF